MRTKVKTSLSNPDELVQFGVPVLCDGASRAVLYSPSYNSPPPECHCAAIPARARASNPERMAGWRINFIGAFFSHCQAHDWSEPLAAALERVTQFITIPAPGNASVAPPPNELPQIVRAGTRPQNQRAGR